MRSRSDVPTQIRGIAYWLALLAAPCPGCGMTGGEMSPRSGTPCVDETGRDFVLCVECSELTETLAPDSPEGKALNDRISAALG